MRRLWCILASVPMLCDGAEEPEGVILLHGLCRTAASMERMAGKLGDAGFIVVNRGYPSRQAGIEELGESAVGGALADPRLAECRRVHFVTHSLGGILVRSYFSRRTDDRLGRVVMLGPPNRGSEVVDRIGGWRVFRKLNGPAGAELGTGTDSAPMRLGGVDFELGVVAGNRTINWINSLMIKGPDDGKVSVERTRVEGIRDHVTVPVTHPFLMKRKRVIDLTIRFLRHGSFLAEGSGPAGSPGATGTPR